MVIKEATLPQVYNYASYVHRILHGEIILTTIVPSPTLTLDHYFVSYLLLYKMLVYLFGVRISLPTNWMELLDLWFSFLDG